MSSSTSSTNSPTPDELNKLAVRFMEVTGVTDLDRAKRFVQNSKPD